MKKILFILGLVVLGMSHAQLLHVAMETHRSEEDHHAEILHRAVELAFYTEKDIEQKRQQGYDQAAGHRRRDAEALEEGNLPSEKHSQEQGNRPHSRARIHIQSNDHPVKQKRNFQI